MRWYWAVLLTVALSATNWVIYAYFGVSLMLFTIGGTCLWAAFDSVRIELRQYKSGISYGPVALFVGLALLWAVGFPWYLVVRGRIKRGLAELKTDRREGT